MCNHCLIVKEFKDNSESFIQFQKRSGKFLKRNQRTAENHYGNLLWINIIVNKKSLFDNCLEGEMNIRKAMDIDFDRIMEIYKNAQLFMIESGNPNQWGTLYPSPELIREDILAGISYVIEETKEIHGVFVMMKGPDPTYQKIEGAWLNKEPYVVIHRIASDRRVRGVVTTAVDYCKRNCNNIRIDTHFDNRVMQKQIERNGFVECGMIYVDDGSARIAYQWSRN